MHKIAYIFPGQGSQFVGMGQSIYNDFKAAKDVFSLVEEYSNLPIRKLCFDGPEEDLKRTLNTQNTILAVSLAIYECLKSQGFPMPDYVSGHSLGELTSLYVAGCLNPKDVIQLVALRSRLMDNCPLGTMAAIMGIEVENLEALVKETNSDCGASQDPKVVIANYNLPGQLIVSGEIEAVTQLAKSVKDHKGKAIMLKVGGAFHSPLMNQAYQIFKQSLEDVNFMNAKCPVVQNYDAKATTFKDSIKFKLANQINSPVLWFQSIETMLNEGVETFVEIGPGNVLTNLIQKYNNKVKVFNIQDSQSLAAVSNELKECFNLKD